MPDQTPENRSDTTPDEDMSEDFAALFEADGAHKDTGIARDAQIEGSVVSIGDEWVFVDVGGKSEGSIARNELEDEQGELTVKIGDSIRAYVVDTRGDEIRLSVKMTAAAGEDAIRNAYRSGLPVEGAVSGERKGGYTVSVFGKQAFCPFSQMDLQPGNAADYIGQRYVFRVKEFTDKGRNIVLSRRDVLEEERRRRIVELRKTLNVGDVITGEVRKLAQFGAFVDIGGTEGLIPMSELAWKRVKESSDVLTAGETVTVRVLDLDWDHNRVTLSLKAMQQDPWSAAAEHYHEGKSVSGTVVKLMNFGAFVELEAGIEGLIHVSNLGQGRRVNHPKEVVAEGDQVEVRVISVDPVQKRIGLELKAGEDEPVVEYEPAQIVTGTVDSVKEYGVFVNLQGRRTGLLHVSEIGDYNAKDLRKRFPPGSHIEVRILSVDTEANRISLSVKGLRDKEEKAHYKDFGGESGGSRTTFGTLGDILKDKLKQ